MKKDESIALLFDVCHSDPRTNINDFWITNDELLAFANACEKLGMEKVAKYFESLGDRECDSCAKAIRSLLHNIP